MHERRRQALSLPLAALLLCSACRGDAESDRSVDPPSAYEVVDPPTEPSGSPTEIQGARSRDGKVQVVVAGGACAWLSGFTVDVTATAINVQAFAADSNGDEPCTMQIVPWLVDLQLDQPIGTRKLVDLTTNAEVGVVECSEDDPQRWCSVGAWEDGSRDSS